MSRKELIDYFNEHILYELMMLRYATTRMTENQTQILWNALFSTFNLSARNLYEFFNNKGSRNEVNVKDYAAYYGNYSRVSISDITGTMQKINEQVFHLGVKRPKEPDKKINMGRIREVADWVEKSMAALVDNFEQGFRNDIQMGRANPFNGPDDLARGYTGPGPRPTATNHVTFVEKEKD